MKGLDFLKKASLAANEVVKPVLARTTAAKNRNPETADIRVYKNGAVYPSASLVQRDNLTFAGKEATDKGNAYDVFMSTDYLNTQSWPADEKVIFIAKLPRTEPKTDLFSSTKYDEAGAPTADVMTQGANTFGQQLLAMIESTYGIVLTGDEEFIDLVIMGDNPFATADGIYYVPKKISRGDKKGSSDLVRRENLTLFPLVPISLLTEDKPKEDANIQEPELEEADAASYVPESARKSK